MVRTIRNFAGIAFLLTAVLFAGSIVDRTVFAADEKKEDKKLEMPKLPGGSKPKWDFESVEEKFTLVKGGINDNGQIYFLVELKEDMAVTPMYKVIFTDSEGIKFTTTSASCDPSMGKKGDRVRLIFAGAAPVNNKDTWAKAVAVRIVAE